MIFIRLNENLLIKYRKEIYNFFEKNYDVKNFFHPHELSYSGLGAEVICNPKNYYVVLLDNNSITSYGLLRGWQDGFQIPSLGILVNKENRGTGCGKIMMNHLQEIAKKEGAKKIRLTVYKENIEAISLYNKLGYNFSEKNPKELIGIKEL